MKKIFVPICTIAICLTACKSSNKIASAKTNLSFDKQGHRGCRGLMPENTIPAMLKAVELGVNTLETDIVFTSDKVAILSHEPFYNEVITTYPPSSFLNESEPKLFNIYKMNFAATQKFDVGIKGNPKFPQQQKMHVAKPSLAAMIDSVETFTTLHKLPKVFYNLETKTKPETDNIFHPAPAEFVELLMKTINEKNIADRVIIQSFDMRTLQYLHKKYPEMRTALLAEADDKSSFRKQINDLGFTPSIYSPAETLVTANLISDCHEKNIKVIPWTVNTKSRIKELRKMGVDGVISDYPNLF